MQAEQFIIWLKGYLDGVATPTAEQIAEIRAKLASIDPNLSRGPARHILRGAL